MSLQGGTYLNCSYMVKVVAPIGGLAGGVFSATSYWDTGIAKFALSSIGYK